MSYNSPEEDGVVISMDYVKGRACKMTVWKKGGDLQIRDSWYDHTDDQFDELLSTFNISRGSKGEHGAACNCSDCRDR
jgi:hypothetical protein